MTSAVGFGIETKGLLVVAPRALCVFVCAAVADVTMKRMVVAH